VGLLRHQVAGRSCRRRRTSGGWRGWRRRASCIRVGRRTRAYQSERGRRRGRGHGPSRGSRAGAESSDAVRAAHPQRNISVQLADADTARLGRACPAGAWSSIPATRGCGDRASRFGLLDERPARAVAEKRWNITPRAERVEGHRRVPLRVRTTSADVDGDQAARCPSARAGAPRAGPGRRRCLRSSGAPRPCAPSCSAVGPPLQRSTSAIPTRAIAPGRRRHRGPLQEVPADLRRDRVRASARTRSVGRVSRRRGDRDPARSPNPFGMDDDRDRERLPRAPACSADARCTEGVELGFFSALLPSRAPFGRPGPASAAAPSRGRARSLRARPRRRGRQDAPSGPARSPSVAGEDRERTRPGRRNASTNAAPVAAQC
jgi:hypothetical protein